MSTMPASLPFTRRRRRGGRSSLSVRLMLGTGAALVALVALLAIFAPLLTGWGPTQIDPDAIRQPPSAAHPLGTDLNGMDVWSRLLFAGRIDLGIAIVAVALAVAIGSAIGAVSGYVGGWLDEALNRFAEIVQSIPLFLFALMIFAALGNSKTILVAVVAIVNIPIFLKLTRSVVQPIKNQDYIAAARLAGRPTSRIVLRHVLPNTLGPIVSQASISAAYAIQITAGLAFIGLGVELPHPEWGSMIQQGAPLIMNGDWWVSVFPGLAVLLAVVAFGGIGRQIARRYDR